MDITCTKEMIEAGARALADMELGHGVYDDLPNDYGEVPVMSAQTNRRQFRDRASACFLAMIQCQ